MCQVLCLEWIQCSWYLLKFYLIETKNSFSSWSCLCENWHIMIWLSCGWYNCSDILILGKLMYFYAKNIHPDMIADIVLTSSNKEPLVFSSILAVVQFYLLITTLSWFIKTMLKKRWKNKREKEQRVQSNFTSILKKRILHRCLSLAWKKVYWTTSMGVLVVSPILVGSLLWWFQSHFCFYCASTKRWNCS